MYEMNLFEQYRTAEQLDLFQMEPKLKTWLYVFKAFKETFQIEARTKKAAIDKILKEWGINEFPATATILER